MRRERRITSRKGAEIREQKRNRLKRFSPDEAEQWVEDNVNDLPSAKRVIKKLARAIAALMPEDE